MAPKSITKTRQRYSQSLKRKVVEFYLNQAADLGLWEAGGKQRGEPRPHILSNSDIARKFDIKGGESSVRDFWNKFLKGELDDEYCKGSMNSKAIQTVSYNKYPAVVDHLNDFIQKQLRRKLSVTPWMLLDEAVGKEPELKERQMNDPGFENAMKSWMARFRKSYNWSLRRITKKGQALPEDSDELVIAAAKRFILLCLKRNITNPHQALTYDETRVLFEMTGEVTLHYKGADSIEIGTGPGGRRGCTVVLCNSADGQKCKAYVIFEGTAPWLLKNTNDKRTVYSS